MPPRDETHYHFILGNGRNTYSISYFSWFLSIGGRQDQSRVLRLQNSVLGTIEINEEEWNHFAIQINTTTGEYTLYANNVFDTSGTHSYFTKTNSGVTLQMNGFSAFSSSYGKPSKLFDVRVVNANITQDRSRASSLSIVRCPLVFFVAFPSLSASPAVSAPHTLASF